MRQYFMCLLIYIFNNQPWSWRKFGKVALETDQTKMKKFKVKYFQWIRFMITIICFIICFTIAHQHNHFIVYFYSTHYFKQGTILFEQWIRRFENLRIQILNSLAKIFPNLFALKMFIIFKKFMTCINPLP